MTVKTTGGTTSRLTNPAKDAGQAIGYSPAELANISRSRRTRMQGRFHTQVLPWLVLAVSLAVTYLLWQGARQNAMQALQTQFEFQARDAAREVDRRMGIYEQVMRGVDGLFAHASIVERDEFRHYIARLGLKENYPGVQGIRFVQMVPHAEKDRHTAAIRKQGLADYTIFPEGQRDIYAPVIYIEPFDWRNQQVFGYDMLSDNEYPRPGDSGVGLRRNAMEQARDSGEATITGKLTLLFETEKDRQSGFAMFLPVYKHDAPHDTGAERRASIIGWICSVFRMHDLMNAVLSDHIDFANIDIDIYDGAEASAKMLMYDSEEAGHDPDDKAVFHSTQRLEVSGRVWTMVVRSNAGFEAQLDKEKPKVVAAVGTVISLLLALLTWLLVMGRERALQSSAAVERVSRKNEMLLRTASDGIYIFDLDGNVMQVNDAFCRMLGYTQEEMLGMNVAQWNAQWPKEELMAKIAALGASNAVFETRHRRRDGSIVDVEVSASRVEIDGQQLIYNSARDITERKRTEDAFRTIAGTAAAKVGETFFQETVSSLCALLEADCVIIGKLVDGNRVQSLGMQLDGKVIEHYEYALPGTPCDDVSSKGYCEHPENICQLFPSDTDLVNMGAESYVGAPTRGKDGNVNGILCAISRRKLVPQPMRREVMEIIADRAGAEIEREQAELALRESEERWGFALEGAGDGVWDWDLQTGKIVFSQRYKEILGFSGDTNWGSLSDWTDRVNQEDMGRAMVALEAYLDGKSESYTVE